jgi:glycosyltransferase involved in cell wall biosynthesis
MTPGASTQAAGGQPDSAGHDGPGPLAVSVVICAYTERRWELTQAAVRSALAQEPAPQQVLLVIDHNATLAERARRDLVGVEILESAGAPGLSGARNTGLQAASEPVTVFLDDDAEARPGWLASLTEPFGRADVVATGGSIYPRWPGARPAWLPPAFDWVVGCSYQGLPDSQAPIRNPIGANMSMRTALALDAGGFSTVVGRVGGKPRGCEETELAIRLTARETGSVVLYVPAAAVDHSVARERVRLGYFLRRCWNEGVSKAIVVRLAGSGPGLERERRQATVVIPRAMAADLRAFFKGEAAALARAVVAALGLAAATGGYLSGRLFAAGADKREARAGQPRLAAWRAARR